MRDASTPDGQAVARLYLITITATDRGAVDPPHRYWSAEPFAAPDSRFSGGDDGGGEYLLPAGFTHRFFYGRWEVRDAAGRICHFAEDATVPTLLGSVLIPLCRASVAAVQVPSSHPPRG